MIYSTNEVKKRIYIDSQREAFYDFDHILQEEIKLVKSEKYLEKLYRGLPSEADLQAISTNIAEDFGLDGKLEISNKRNSYYYFGSIYIHPICWNNKNLETLLHEYAHLFMDCFFSTGYETAHGGEFAAALRFLLDFYDIVPKETYNELISTFAEDVSLYDNYIESFEFLTIEDFCKEKTKSKKKEVFNNNFTCRKFYLNFEKEEIHTKDQYHFYYSNGDKNKFIRVVLNKFAYETDHPFKKLSIEEILNTRLVSNVFIMDWHARPVKKYEGFQGFAEYRGDYFLHLKDDQETISSVSWASPEIVHTNNSQRFDICIPKEKVSGTRYANKKRKEYIQKCRKEGINIVTSNSQLEFDFLQEQFKHRCHELHQQQIQEKKMLEY
tara:strand:+ start:9110 stop:10255 length:1146 start_codon:yes stop_codon:yes gene_type:complete